MRDLDEATNYLGTKIHKQKKLYLYQSTSLYPKIPLKIQSIRLQSNSFVNWSKTTLEEYKHW